MNDAQLIATVSTVKDTAEGLGRFVDRNLAAGADHMFVFLDEGDAAPGVEQLRSNPHVTAVVTDDAYWGGDRPDALNLRQQANASLATFLLSATGWASWLVHLDSDECLHLRRADLEALPPSVRAVRLSVWEAVSSADAVDVGLFKREITASEEAVLHALGHRRYFRGHRVGKTAVRPSFDVWFKNHAAVDGHGTPVPAVSREGLHLLHYESPNLAEFVRKWDAHRQDAERQARRRGPNARKTQVAAAVMALLDNEALGADARERLLRRVYERHVADPVDLLQELGYLVSPGPALHRHDPTPLSAAQATQLNDVLDALRGVGKQRFTRRHVLDGNQRLRGTLRARHPELARGLPLL